MTRPPRPTREPGDNRNLLEALGKIGERIDQLADSHIRSDARQDANVKENARVQAETQSVVERMAREQVALTNVVRENYAVTTAGYRELQKGQENLGDRLTALEARAPDVITAADSAANKAISANKVEEQHTRSSMHRTTGWAILLGGGASVWGALNFITLHWQVIIGGLRWFGGVLRLLPPAG